MSFDLAIVGLGYVGMPLAHAACGAGLSVLGYDISPDVVRRLAGGESHVPDLARQDVKQMLAGGFCPTTDAARVAEAATVVICVPTALLSDGSPDLGPLRSAANLVAAGLRPGTLVVVESTSYPGTTEELIRPILQSSGLTAGRDFHLAFSPERVDPGNRRFGIRSTAKIVSGCTPVCARRCAEFYQRFVETVVMAKGTREAEMAKLLENTYRSVNIALVNEIAEVCHRLGIDVWDVVRCAATKPFGFQAFWPGPGVGGHCIPVDPDYLVHKAKAEGIAMQLVPLAQHVNASMTGYVAERAGEILARRGKRAADARILLLGVTYKPDVADARESPAAGVAHGLACLGATVEYHDPYVERFTAGGAVLPRCVDLDEGLGRADLVILLQAHGCYDLARLPARCAALFDTRGKASGPNVERL